MDCDLLLLCGEHWWEGFRQSRFAVNLASAEAAKKPRIEYCGCPYHDSAATMEPAQIRMKYGIPSERPVLLYLPLGLARPSSDVRWQRLIRFWLLRKYGCDDRRLLDRLTASCFAPFASWNVSELSLMRAMREFCDRQDVCLVLKGRVKKPISEATCALADLVLYDETFHPTTMTELLSVSELLVTHFSMAVFEAMNIGVYNINIGLGPMFDAQVALIDDLFPGDWREDLTTSGVNEIQDAADFIRSFGESQLADYHLDGVSQQAAAAKYFSCPPGKATKQCVDALLE